MKATYIGHPLLEEFKEFKYDPTWSKKFPKKHIRAILKHNKDDFPIVDERHTHNLMHDAKIAIATSGTVNLQLALHGVPTAVTYSIRRLDQFIAQKLLRINLPYYSLPNIIAQKEIFPEF